MRFDGRARSEAKDADPALLGARFGPQAIRIASARQTAFRGMNRRAGINPYKSWARVLDCSDIPITPLDHELAYQQMTEAFLELGTRPRAWAGDANASDAKDVRIEYTRHPKLIALGGDHSITLPALRALRTIYQEPIAVVHFDAHLDTWAQSPNKVWPSEQSLLSHASVFWIANEEGLLRDGSCVHAGLRTRLTGTSLSDYKSDTKQGWLQIESDDLDKLGHDAVVKMIMDRIDPNVPVYLSVDIDVLDPAFAPGTGTLEPGGWSTRELIRILRAVESLNVIGADVVEIAPIYDSNSEITALAGAQVVYELMSSIVKRGLANHEENKSARDVRDEL